MYDYCPSCKSGKAFPIMSPPYLDADCFKCLICKLMYGYLDNGWMMIKRGGTYAS